MTNAEDSAYPIVLQEGITHSCHVDAGLTKREMFAMAVIQGLCANYRLSGTEKDIATECVSLADALIAALNQKGEDHA